jgi:hypothetical protein
MIMITLMVTITVTVDAHNPDFRVMTTSVPVVVSLSEVDRYASLFRDHRGPIRLRRSRKRGTGQKDSKSQCSTGEHRCFFHDVLSVADC